MAYFVIFILLLVLCAGILFPSFFGMEVADEKPLRKTLIHELLHTVPDGLRHTGEWKKWARYVSARTGYNIQRCDGDETEEDRKRLRNGVN